MDSGFRVVGLMVLGFRAHGSKLVGFGCRFQALRDSPGLVGFRVRIVESRL